MFRNIKKLSEYSLLNERFTHLITGTTPGKELPPPEAPQEKPKDIYEGLAALKMAVGEDFKIHLEENEKGVKAFIASGETDGYDPGEWKQWNVKLLEHMGFNNVSEEDAGGVIRRFQEYLKIAVDGQFGPGMLKALRSYYKKLDEESASAWKKENGIQKYLVNADTGFGVERYYRHPDGTFYDESHVELKGEELVKIIPKISRYKAEAMDFIDIYEDNFDIYGIEIADGKIAYYTVEGKPVIVVDEEQAQPETPEPVPPVPAPAPAPVVPKPPAVPQPTPEPPGEPEIPKPPIMVAKTDKPEDKKEDIA